MRAADGLLLRDAVAEDGTAVGAMFSEACRQAYGDILSPEFIARNYRPGVQEARWEERIRGARAGFRIVVATRSDAIVGAVHVGPPAETSPSAEGLTEVHHVFVRPDRHRGGVGTALLDEARRGLAAEGSSTVVLWVFEANAGARSFYARTGWRFTGVDRVDPSLVDEGMQVRECLYESGCSGHGRPGGRVG